MNSKIDHGLLVLKNFSRTIKSIVERKRDGIRKLPENGETSSTIMGIISMIFNFLKHNFDPIVGKSKGLRFYMDCIVSLCEFSHRITRNERQLRINRLISREIVGISLYSHSRRSLLSYSLEGNTRDHFSG